jgi:hypothetical protein
VGRADDIRVRREPPSGYDVEGTATERQEPDLELPRRTGRSRRSRRPLP